MKKILFSTVRLIIALSLGLCNFTAFSDEAASSQQNTDLSTEKCLDVEKKKIIAVGWDDIPPYQYNKMTSAGYKLTGMDVEIIKAISAKIGIEANYSYISWAEHQQKLKTGEMDLAGGATFTEERSKFAYFSVPYRFEQNSLFISKNTNKSLNFKNIPEFLAQVRLQNFRLGIVNGYVFADSRINEFIQDPNNKDIIFVRQNDTECLNELLSENIDGWISDRLIGANVIFEKSVEDKVVETLLNAQVPIHLMFSKKSVPIELVDNFNQNIKEFVRSSEYKNIIKTYLYPVLLLQTLGSDWFYIVGIIGTIAFAISGIAVAAKENATLFGTFLFSMIPSVSGGIMRDVILNRSVVGIFLTPSYVYYILIIVIVGFFLVRLLEFYNDGQPESVALINKFWDRILLVFDALGQAALIVTGVTIVIIAKINPLELWGAFFAFLTASGGTILRDLLKKDRVITCISKGINAEISVIWGLIFSMSLNYISDNPNPVTIRYIVITVVLGAFISRLASHYFNIPNPKFRNE